MVSIIEIGDRKEIGFVMSVLILCWKCRIGVIKTHFEAVDLGILLIYVIIPVGKYIPFTFGAASRVFLLWMLVIFRGNLRQLCSVWKTVHSHTHIYTTIQGLRFRSLHATGK